MAKAAKKRAKVSRAKASMLKRALAGERLDDLEIIDFHAHLGRWDSSIAGATAESVVKSMDRLGVKQAFLSALECMSIHVRQGNDEVLRAMREYPGRFLGYAAAWPGSPEGVKDEIERRLDEGFSGIKLHIGNGFDYTHPAYGPAWEIAHERRLPVLLHTYGEQPGLNQVPGLATLYKGANIVLGHSGVGTIEEYIRQANVYPNVYLELCSSMTRPGVVDRLAEGAPIEKLLWGSDVLFVNMAQQLGKVLGSEMTEGAKRKVLSGNARRVLGMMRKQA